MRQQFEELDYQKTPIGALSLRRRHEPLVGQDIYEVKLDDDFLMSSLFTASETALADLAIDQLADSEYDIVVGGLGLGYTAGAVLNHQSVRSLLVVDLLPTVIQWHESNLLPLSSQLVSDPRTRLFNGDFFALVASNEGFDELSPGRRYHAILLDIDHSPEALLDERSRSFYEEQGLQRLQKHLLPSGIFALWSNNRPDVEFTKRLERVFASASAEAVVFDNPYQSKQAMQTVYLARAHS
ncbi:MAG: spermidine synthase [Hyphomicrobiaceae bacterium]